jgi:hypothetical protein
MKKLFTSVILQAIFGLSSAFAQWSSPVNISPHAMSAAMNESMGPCMVASNDTLHVIWSDKRTTGKAIYYTRSIDSGQTWSTPIAITDTNGKATMPSLAVNGRNIHVVWWDSLNEVSNLPNSGNSSFYMHSIDGGNTWASKVCIDSSAIFWPGLAVSGTTVLVALHKGVMDSTMIWLVKSTDNGNTFGTAQRVSTRTGYGRSEDMSTATDGKYIHMTWNDNRSGTMEIYYRRSKDMGVTWDPEVAMTSMGSYTTMVSLDSGHVDISHGLDNTYWNSWIRQSSDSGTTWNADEQVTTNINSNNTEEYPFLVREGSNMHITSVANGNGNDEIYYSYSGDGGATWTPQVLLQTLTNGGWLVPFIALTCPALHVVYPYEGAIYYMRNPTGNPSCPTIPTSIENLNPSTANLLVYPNPVSDKLHIQTASQIKNVEVTDIAGRIIYSGNTKTIDCSTFAKSVYFVRTLTDKGIIVLKFVKA